MAKQNSRGNPDNIGVGKGKRVIPNDVKVSAVLLARDKGPTQAARDLNVTRRAVQNWMAGRNIDMTDIDSPEAISTVTAALLRRQLLRFVDYLGNVDLETVNLRDLTDAMERVQRIAALLADKPTSISKTVATDDGKDRVARLAKLIDANQAKRIGIVAESESGEVTSAVEDVSACADADDNGDW